jgi:hypothetical protein
LKPLKPYRSYHCAACDRDVLMMNHHSPLVDNCIGLNNQRYFLLLLTYLSLATVTITSLSACVAESRTLIALTLFNGLAATVLVPLTLKEWRVALSGITRVERAKIETVESYQSIKTSPRSDSQDEFIELED